MHTCMHTHTQFSDKILLLLCHLGNKKALNIKFLWQFYCLWNCISIIHTVSDDSLPKSHNMHKPFCASTHKLQ